MPANIDFVLKDSPKSVTNRSAHRNENGSTVRWQRAESHVASQRPTKASPLQHVTNDWQAHLRLLEQLPYVQNLYPVPLFHTLGEQKRPWSAAQSRGLY